MVGARRILEGREEDMECGRSVSWIPEAIQEHAAGMLVIGGERERLVMFDCKNILLNDRTIFVYATDACTTSIRVDGYTECWTHSSFRSARDCLRYAKAVHRKLIIKPYRYRMVLFYDKICTFLQLPCVLFFC